MHVLLFTRNIYFMNHNESMFLNIPDARTASGVIRKVIRCPYGRYVTKNVEINTTTLNLMCVYAPYWAKNRKEFMANVEEFVPGSELTVLGGDLNFLENNHVLDIVEGRSIAPPEQFCWYRYSPTSRCSPHSLANTNRGSDNSLLVMILPGNDPGCIKKKT